MSALGDAVGLEDLLEEDRTIRPGGVPQRLTWHPSEERLCDWTPDGGALVTCSRDGTLRTWEAAGLAAPQVGLDIRMLVVEVPVDEEGKLDLDALIDRLDVNIIAQRLDLDALVDRTVAVARTLQ